MGGRKGKRYFATFEFAETEQDAKRLVEFRNWNATSYCRKKHPAHYTPWSSSDNTIHKFIVWYYI